MFGVVARFSPHVFAVGLRFAIGLVIAAALILVASTAIGVAARLSCWLAEHVQLPARVAAPDARYGSPVVGITAFAAVVAGALIVAGGGSGAGSLAALFGYGAMLALTAGQAAVIAMRWRDPDRHRPFRVPGGLELAGAELPVLTVLGAAATLTVWIGILAFDHTPALAGSLWMALGVTGYAVYRRRNGMTLTQRRLRPAPAAQGRPRVEVEFHTTLVAVDVRQPAGVAEAVEVAARLAAERRAVVVLVELAEIPLGEEMDVELDELDADAELVTEQAQAVCAQYGIRLIATLLRTRDPVAAILSEADRRDSGVIIVSTAGLRRRDGLLQRLLAQAPQRVMLIQPRKAVV
jgi:APA family basic amino acid/polyamine antiporter